MVLTPQERRGLIVIIGLLLLGTAYDLWRAARPSWTRPPTAPVSAGMAPPSEAPGPSAAPEAAAPLPGGGASPGPPGPGVAAVRSGDLPTGGASIDLNVADAPTLERLPGVGPVLAGRIVAHRREHGRFETVDDLRAVRGIGPRLLERLRPWVRVSRPPPGR